MVFAGRSNGASWPSWHAPKTVLFSLLRRVRNKQFEISADGKYYTTQSKTEQTTIKQTNGPFFGFIQAFGKIVEWRATLFLPRSQDQWIVDERAEEK